ADSMNDLAEKLADTVALDPSDLVDVLEMLAGIQAAQSYFDTPPDEFVRGVITAANRDENFKFPKPRQSKIESTLLEVVRNSRAIRVASKASELRVETQRRLCSDNC